MSETLPIGALIAFTKDISHCSAGGNRVIAHKGEPAAVIELEPIGAYDYRVKKEHGGNEFCVRAEEVEPRNDSAAILQAEVERLKTELETARMEQARWPQDEATIERLTRELFAERTRREALTAGAAAIHAENERLTVELSTARKHRDEWRRDAAQSAEYIARIGQLLGSTCGDDTPEKLIEELTVERDSLRVEVATLKQLLSGEESPAELATKAAHQLTT